MERRNTRMRTAATARKPVPMAMQMMPARVTGLGAHGKGEDKSLGYGQDQSP